MRACGPSTPSSRRFRRSSLILTSPDGGCLMPRNACSPRYRLVLALFEQLYRGVARFSPLYELPPEPAVDDPSALPTRRRSMTSADSREPTAARCIQLPRRTSSATPSSKALRGLAVLMRIYSSATASSSSRRRLGPTCRLRFANSSATCLLMSMIVSASGASASTMQGMPASCAFPARGGLSATSISRRDGLIVREVSERSALTLDENLRRLRGKFGMILRTR